jgi:hypothetical protein
MSRVDEIKMRVGDGYERESKRNAARAALLMLRDIHYLLSQLKDGGAEERNRIINIIEAKCEEYCVAHNARLAILNAIVATTPTETSERCMECQHKRGQQVDGVCMARVYSNDEPSRPCGCKCVFPASTGSEPEMSLADMLKLRKELDPGAPDMIAMSADPATPVAQPEADPRPKHDPHCDCGICAYCNGQEDVWGNKKSDDYDKARQFVEAWHQRVHTSKRFPAIAPAIKFRDLRILINDLASYLENTKPSTATPSTAAQDARCEHGVLQSMECLNCTEEYVTVKPPDSAALKAATEILDAIWLGAIPLDSDGTDSAAAIAAIISRHMQQPRIYHCSCGAACTAEEYIEHVFEKGHDQGGLNL